MSLSIIPSRQDEALRVLRRIVSFTMFLSSLLIAMILVTSYFIEGVRFELAGQVTVQIATEQSLASVPTSTKKNVYQLVSQVEGVRQISILSLAQVKELMQPWLRSGVDFLDELPLPLILDITVARDSFNPNDIRSVLTQAGYEVVVDDHLLWFARHYGLLNRLHLLLLALMGVIFVALLLVVVRTAHASLALNGETVSVLRIIGGGDGVIARAFASHTLMVTLRSCLLGIFWALVILAAIVYGDDSERLLSLPKRLLQLFGYGMLSLSAVTAFATMVTTWMTCRSLLHRQP